LSLAIFADNRSVTGMEKTDWGEGTRFTVSSREVGGFSLDVSDLRCRKVVPFLIERLKKGQADFDTIDALRATGDARAIPALIDAFNAMAQGTRFEGDADGRAFLHIAYALSKLKAREAVPSLLKHVDDPKIVTCLGDIGDRRAVPALNEIVAAKGRIIQDGKPVNPKLDGERLFAAKVTLAQLDAENEGLRLAEILADPNLERNHRYDVVLRLAIRPDPRAIPSLIAVIKSDSDFQITRMAIDSLSQLKCKAAVEGLIECFDVPFKKKYLRKGTKVTPATYRNQIARSLQTITGQSYGADKQQWLRWWQEHGQQDANLK
jgi:HEAT repeat protein